MCYNQAYHYGRSHHHGRKFGGRPNIRHQYQKRGGAPFFNDFLPVNVRESDDHYKIQVSAPGYNKEDFQISVVDESLILRVKPAGRDEEKKQWQRKEFGARKMKRTFQLNEKIDKDQIQARYEDGVLSITLKKLAEFETKRSDIVVE